MNTVKTANLAASYFTFSIFTELFDVCEILHGDFGSVHNSLVSRTIETRSEVLVTDLSAREAASSRDSLCRAMYGRLFTWLVNRINEAIKMRTPRKHKTVSILDLFGFESTDANGFEQLVVNYANEKLHQVLTAWTLAAEQEDYRQEGIEWNDVDFADNAAVCSLIERNNHGLLSSLDEVSLKKPGVSAHQLSSVMAQELYLGASSDGESTGPTSAEIYLERVGALFKQNPHIEIRGRSPESEMNQFK